MGSVWLGREMRRGRFPVIFSADDDVLTLNCRPFVSTDLMCVFGASESRRSVWIRLGGLAPSCLINLIVLIVSGLYEQEIKEGAQGEEIQTRRTDKQDRERERDRLVGLRNVWSCEGQQGDKRKGLF